MGYTSRDIAAITEPEVISLSALPNFVQFASKPAAKTLLEVRVLVKIRPSTPGDIPTLTAIRFIDAYGKTYTYQGTTNAADVGGPVFLVAPDTADTAENLRQTLLGNKWIETNFDITVPLVWSGGTPRNGAELTIKSKGAGKDYNFAIAAADLTTTAPGVQSNTSYTLTWIASASINNDSICGEASTAEIDLEVYADPGVFLGQDDRPTTASKIGRYLTTLRKTYAGVPLWFELNSLFSRDGAYNRPPDTPGWFDTGTLRAYRFIAGVKSTDSFKFYYSNVLYVLAGNRQMYDDLDMSQFVYDDNAIRLLTNKPRTPYVRGQREFLNFLFSDPQRGVSAPLEFTLRVAYRAYTSGDVYLGTVYGQEEQRANFAMVNSCRLDIDSVLDQFPTAGIVRVALARGVALVSNDLEYTILPPCLHSLRPFSFLNRLGGWDTINLDAGIKSEVKPTIETYNKTITPDFQRGDSIETVYATTVESTLTVEGAPITDEMAAWLSELAEARTILDGDGNYIVVEDFTLAVTDASKNMQRPILKYRLSE